MSSKKNNNRKGGKSKGRKKRGKSSSSGKSNQLSVRSTADVMSPTMLGGFPDSQRVTLRYVESFTLTGTSGVAAYYLFRGNGPYDPNATGTGGQPALYDDWAVEYNKYRCFGSTMRVWNVTVGTTAATITSKFCYGAWQSSASPASIEDMASQPYTKFQTSASYMIPQGLSRPNKMSMSTAKILGMDAVEFKGDDSLEANYNASPALQWYWLFGIQSTDGSSSTVRQLTVMVDYDIQWFDRNNTTIDEKYARILLMREKRQKQSELINVSTEGVESKRSDLSIVPSKHVSFDFTKGL